MELAQLEAFLEVARWGGFRKAAAAMFLSQPALTARIRQLEKETSQSLFERTWKGVTLTPAGMALHPYAERIVEGVRQGRAALQGASPIFGQTLRLGTTPVLGTYVLPDLVAKFTRQFSINMHMQFGRSRDVLEMVLSEDVEIGVARPLSHPRVEIVDIYDERVVLVTHPQHRLAGRGPVTVPDVIGEDLVLFDRESAHYLAVERACQEAGIVPRIHILLDSAEATKQMVKRDLGVAFLPWSAVHDELTMGTLAYVPIADMPGVPLPAVAMLLRGRRQTQPASAFLDMLRADLGRESRVAPTTETPQS